MSRERKARVVLQQKLVLADGHILEARILSVPEPVPGSRHNYKYALSYGRPGHRLLLYDNERLKGDHRHRGGREEPYEFTTVEKLVQDFLADVRALMRQGRSTSGKRNMNDE